MAYARIIGGTSRTGGYIWSVYNTVHIGQLNGVGGESLRGRVASAYILSEAQKKSFLQGAAGGIAGGALLGPVGALAGLAASGNHQEVLFSCQLHSGGQFIARGEMRIFEMLLAESMQPPLVEVSAEAQIISGPFPDGAHLRLYKGLVRLYRNDGPSELMGKQVASVEVSTSNPASTGAGQGSPVTFVCHLRDGRSFMAEGDARVYQAMYDHWKVGSWPNQLKTYAICLVVGTGLVLLLVLLGSM